MVASNWAKWPVATTQLRAVSGHILDTQNKKGLAIARKSLMSLMQLVGGAGFEPATPAV
jgi:hypothetical protein